jgi:tetratricopeptide (TPR) repeat protein
MKPKRYLIVLSLVGVGLFLNACLHPDWKYSAPISRNHEASAHCRRAIEFWQKADWKGTVAEYRKAAELDPNNAAIHIELSWALLWTDEWDDAITEGRTALRLDPNNRKAPEAHWGIGIALEHKGALCDALEEYRAAHLLAPHAVEINMNYERLTSKHLTCPPG